MIDTDKYDNEGIELSDGGTICFPESDGRIKRIDKDGNTMEVRYQSNNEGQEWYELFDTREALLIEVKRLREQMQLLHDTWFADEEMASDVDERMTKRLREGIKAYLNLEIETHELKEMIE